jgi:nucleotide-binding universal stress UspA family protein
MDVTVHLDGSAEDEFRLSYAEMLSAGRDGHIGGVFTNPLPDMARMVTPEAAAAAAEIFAELEQSARRIGDELANRLSRRLSAVRSSTELVRIEGTIGQLELKTTSTARLSDIFIASTPYRDGEDNWDGLFEAVLFGSGRAVLLAPPRHPAGQPVQRVLVAWRDTKEAARAVAAALPILTGATRVDLLLVDPESEGDAPADGIARYLVRHGAKVDVKATASNGRTTAEAILAEARRGESDLIVMGAYGHSRLREWIIGGTTRDLLRSTQIPVLTAH